MQSVFLDGFIAKMNIFSNVLIYGAGGVASDLLVLLDPYCVKKKIHVVVSTKSENDFLNAYPIKSISEFSEVKDDCFVIIAVMIESVNQIIDKLAELGFQNYCTADEMITGMYEEIWNTPIHPKKIVLSHSDGKAYGDNPKYIAEELLRRNIDLDLVWIVQDEDINLPFGIRSVRYGTYNCYKELGTARIWIDDQHKNYFARKRKGQFYLQTWHGGGPLKKIEHDAESLPKSYLSLCEMNAKMIDRMISPSRFNSDLYRSAFHFQGDIMECGYPRNDIFWKEATYRKKIEKKYSLSSECGIVLFAPTFRSQGIKENKLDFTKLRESLKLKFNKTFVVLVRLHPFDAKTSEKIFDWSDKIINVTEYDDVQELFVASDVLITDYSSVMWDFGIQKKPIFLYHPDIKAYEDERGFYLSFDQMPYIESFDNDDLFEKILSFDEKEYIQNISNFYNEYKSFDTGNAATIISNDIVSVVNEHC